MKKPFNYLILFIFTVALLISCSSDDDSVPPVNETPKSEAKQLTSFVFNATNNEALEENVTAVINEADKTITVTVPYGTDITVLQPTIEISEKATINPTGAQNFSSPIDYTVTAEDNTEAVYEVTVSIALNDEKQIISFVFEEDNNGALNESRIAEVNEEEKTITVIVPYNTKISALVPTIEVSEVATISPEGAQEFFSPVNYTVTAEDGTEAVYEVTVEVESNDAKQMLSFQFLATENGALSEDVVAEIDEENKTITATVPNGTDITALISSIEISAGATTITSEGGRNFTNPVSYTVIAHNGTEVVYEVTVEVESSEAKQMLSFQFLASENGALNENIEVEIDEENKTITATVPNGTDVTALIPSIEISAGAIITPEGAQDFSNPVSYTVIAQNDSEAVYEVTVEVESSDAKQMLSFQFLASENEALNENIEVEIDEQNKTIGVTVPNGTDVTALIPSIEISAGAIITPEGAQDFTNPVVYTVTAQNDSEAVYEVTVEVESSNAKQMQSFQFLESENGALSEDIEGEIDQENKTVLVTVPYGTNILAFLPSIEISVGATITPEGAQDFTNPINYTITAEDGTSVIYEVTVAMNSVNERQALIAIFNANPNNTLDWDINNPDSDISTWGGIVVNGNGSVIELLIGGKELITLPPEIGRLTNLNVLIILGNSLETLPSQIGNLTNLTRLNMSLNNIGVLPQEIGNLTNLTSLFIGNNNLEILPSEISNLSSLTTLSLGDNNLETLPFEIYNMVNLTTLFMGNINMGILPEEIGNLTNLTQLWLHNNILETLPVEISNLINLTSLIINNNNLENIPIEMGNLSNLNTLSLIDNDLETIPQAVCDLENTGTNISVDAGVTCEAL